MRPGTDPGQRNSSGRLYEEHRPGTPVVLMEERIRSAYLDAVIVNSGCANAYTGDRGYQDALRMGEIAASALSISPESVGVASTGVIGRCLDLP